MRGIFTKCPISMYLRFQILVNVNLDLTVKGNDKGKRCAAMKLNTSLNDLAVKLRIAKDLDLTVKGNDKGKRCAAMKLNTSLYDLAVKLRIDGRHHMIFYLSSLPIAALRSLDTEANRFYDKNHQMYDAALLTRCYTQHALRPFIDSESNHILDVLLKFLS